MRFLPRIWVLLVVACLAACASTKEKGTPVVQFAGTEGLPAPTIDDMASPQRAYRVGPFDKLSISVFGAPDLSRTVQADSTGRIDFPLVGEVSAAGRTPREIQVELAERLRGKYVRNPQVTVNLESTVSQVFTVSGQVKQPGSFPVIGRMTLVRAIAQAQGLEEFAKLEDVVVFRTVNNQRMAALYNLKSIQNGYYEDPEIYPNDVIVVGDSPARRLFRDVLQVAPIALSTVLTLILR